MARIVSLGSALQDVYLIDRDDFVGDSVFTQLKIGSKVDIDRIRYFAGGGGTNVAVTMARSGHEAYFVGNLGNDHAGAAVRAELAREHVNTDFAVTLPRKATGVSVVLLDQRSGERTILTCRGASAVFANLEPQVLATLQPDWLYVTTLRGDFATLRRFFVEAKKRHAQIMFNPGNLELASPRQLFSLLQFVDVLLVNREEAAQLVAGESPLELLLRLKNYVPTVIITNNCLGAMALTTVQTQEGRPRLKGYQLPIYPTPRVRDTTGAGDAFGSGFLAARARGRTFRQSLVFAAANASAVVQQLGAKAGILAGDAELRPMLVSPIKGLNREEKNGTQR